MTSHPVFNDRLLSLGLARASERAALTCANLIGRGDEKARAIKAGITDFDGVYARNDMVADDVILAATGVTDGSITAGVKRREGDVETVLMRSRTGSLRRMIYRSPLV